MDFGSSDDLLHVEMAIVLRDAVFPFTQDLLEFGNRHFSKNYDLQAVFQANWDFATMFGCEPKRWQEVLFKHFYPQWEPELFPGFADSLRVFKNAGAGVALISISPRDFVPWDRMLVDKLKGEGVVPSHTQLLTLTQLYEGPSYHDRVVHTLLQSGCNVVVDSSAARLSLVAELSKATKQKVRGVLFTNEDTYPWAAATLQHPATALQSWDPECAMLAVKSALQTVRLVSQ